MQFVTVSIKLAGPVVPLHTLQSRLDSVNARSGGLLSVSLPSCSTPFEQSNSNWYLNNRLPVVTVVYVTATEREKNRSLVSATAKQEKWWLANVMFCVEPSPPVDSKILFKREVTSLAEGTEQPDGCCEFVGRTDRCSKMVAKRTSDTPLPRVLVMAGCTGGTGIPATHCSTRGCFCSVCTRNAWAVMLTRGRSIKIRL